MKPAWSQYGKIAFLFDYVNLQAKFPAGQPGYAYAEMAQAFWEDYQASQDIGQACGKAVAYATAHADSLTYLGSDYHGLQSHIYKPDDVCPFKQASAKLAKFWVYSHYG